MPLLAPILACFIGVGLAATLPAATALQPTDWPHLRGPDFTSGTVPEADWLQPWTAPERLWAAEAGIGQSGIVVVDGKALTLGHQDGKDVLTCYAAADGSVLWTHSYEEPLADNAYKGGPNITPTVVDGKVFWYSRQGLSFCLELASGKEIWQRQLQYEEALNPPRWGFTGAPLPVGDSLILNMGEAGMAIDRATGTTLWKNGHGGAGYAAPVLVETTAGQRVLLFTGTELIRLDPAGGAIDWRTSWQTEWNVNAAAPILTEHGIIVSSGYKTGTGLLDLETGKQIWFSDAIKHQMAGPVLVDGFIYGVNASKGEPGLLYCMDPADGSVKWATPGFGNGSVIAAGDRILALSEAGKLVLAKASPAAYEELASAQVLDNAEKVYSWNTPALAGGRIYAKNDLGKLVCYDISQ